MMKRNVVKRYCTGIVNVNGKAFVTCRFSEPDSHWIMMDNLSRISLWIYFPNRVRVKLLRTFADQILSTRIL